MNNNFVTTLALTSTLGVLATAVSAQAASRTVEFSAPHFVSRCNDLGGRLSDASPELSCMVGQVNITCNFVGVNLAACNWPGIDNLIAVNRLIGLPQAVSISGDSGAAAMGTAPGPGKPDPKMVDMAPLPSKYK